MIGTRAVSKSVINSYPDADIQIGIVWIKMNNKDTFQAAQNISDKFNDPRVTQFYDPSQRSGKVLASALPVKAEVAWDIYLFYAAGAAWHENPPAPAVWMHQLSETWLDRKHYRSGDDLIRELSGAMEKFFVP